MRHSEGDSPVVLLTARSQDADIFEGRRSGASDYLPKPFSPAQLLDSVARSLSAPPLIPSDPPQ